MRDESFSPSPPSAVFGGGGEDGLEGLKKSWDPVSLSPPTLLVQYQISFVTYSLPAGGSNRRCWFRRKKEATASILENKSVLFMTPSWRKGFLKK